MDASLYYTDITPDVDLLLQNVTLTVNRPRSNDNTTSASPKAEITSSPSTSVKKSVTFEDTDIFALHNINLSVQKVRKHFMTLLSNINQIFVLCRDN